MKNVALHNLGCKTNAYEMDVMQQMLQEKGYSIVPFDTEADIYIINTCTVTNIADRKSRQMLHRAKKKNPDAVVVAVGCYVQTGKEDVEKDSAIDLAVGNNRKKDLVEILEAFLSEREQEKANKTLNDTSVIDINHTDEYEEMTLEQTAEHTRAYIKIQDGCNQFCSYCIIPYARGRVRSRKEEDILREIRGLAENGYKEIVLTGIHISSYGIDLEDRTEHYKGQDYLIALVEKIHEISGIERIRLGSLEPRIITQDTANRLAALPKVCPHFHLSLQSGCDDTLKRMNRHYTAGEYWKCVENLRKAYAHPAITTDVIVGFPGETQEEFEQTRDYLEKLNLYEMHVFRYSVRKGTMAATMKNQVPEPVKAHRSDVLLAMEQKQSKDFRQFYIGAEVEVLYEEAKEINGKIYQVGHTKEYVKVAKETARDLTNKLCTEKISDFLKDDILLAGSVEFL
ncbi:MAG: tRNA (N(6)-L-threonylcarbamoyladenosine(37)-C(2))-methylthiotransferase MtaB [Lachnospiraceae bacterium]|nr:tRNA (N(6)-L-threonylcarbamoyladenosine(37)-C(2))-methylthiotransferase MtaB [Lachnospiraceae bacterium]